MEKWGRQKKIREAKACQYACLVQEEDSDINKFRKLLGKIPTNICLTLLKIECIYFK